MYKKIYVEKNCLTGLMHVVKKLLVQILAMHNLH